MTTTFEQPRRPWQFGLKSALTWTLQACVLLAVVRYTHGFPVAPAALVALVATWYGSKHGALTAIFAASLASGLAAAVVASTMDSAWGSTSGPYGIANVLAIAAFWFIGGAFIGALIGLFVGLPIVIARHHWTRNLARSVRLPGRPAGMGKGS
jgi:hypothetical protein